MRILILVGAVAGAIVLATGLCMRRGEVPLRRNDLPRGFKSPVVAIQMARSMQEVGRIVGEPGREGRSRMRRLQYADFLFIAAYWLLLAIMGVLTWQRGSPLVQLLGALVATFATMAAFFDILENVAILRVLRARDTEQRSPGALSERRGHVEVASVLYHNALAGFLPDAKRGLPYGDWRRHSVGELIFPRDGCLGADRDTSA